jgi:sn-glycerol 3-phosphate transport system ATP-binding protein
MGRAMIREPAVFLYDEPLSNLDAKLRISMRGEIRRLHRRLGTTSLFVTHDQIEAMTLADRIVVMNEGKIEQIGTPQEIYHRPASLFVADFVGSPGFNLIEGRYDEMGQCFVSGQGQVMRLDHRTGFEKLPSHVIMGFRAESVSFNGEGEGLKIKIDYVEDLGASRHVHGFFGDQKIIVSVSGENSIGAGEYQQLIINPSDLHFFDPSSGQRLN